ncbi:TPA: PAQR family membrane homeostasis protein TrhA [Acinetobacter baumannii]
MSKSVLETYDPKEELFNAYSHGAGVVMAVIASVFLIIKGSYLSTAQWIGLWVYAFSLILVFTSSTLYHFAQTQILRYWYKKLDHTAIYYLIAGTYTPFLSIAIPTQKAHILLIALWSIAAIGTLFKLVFIHRFQKISLLAYVLMGWLAVFVMDDMRTYLSKDTLMLLITGGLAYTVGALFYALKKVRYTHAIWHIFVLLGAGAHFLAIYWYVV